MSGLFNNQNKIFLADDLHLSCNHPFSTFFFLVFYFVSFLQIKAFKGRDMNKDVLSRLVVGNEPITFGLIIKFYCTGH